MKNEMNRCMSCIRSVRNFEHKYSVSEGVSSSVVCADMALSFIDRRWKLQTCFKLWANTYHSHVDQCMVRRAVEAVHSRYRKSRFFLKWAGQTIMTSVSSPYICVVCWKRLRDTMLNPCSHVSCCSFCVETMTECPMCRSPISDTTRCFLS
jgi:hypothetical protein